MKDKKKVLEFKTPSSLSKCIALSVISNLPLPRSCILLCTLYKYGKAASK